MNLSTLTKLFPSCIRRQSALFGINFALFILFLLQAIPGESQKARLIIPSGHTNPVTAIALSPDEKTLATSEGLPFLKIWDAESGKELYSLEGHTEAVNDLAFQPDGYFLASASNDKTIVIWDLRKAAKRIVLTGHKDAVTSVRFLKDGNRVLSASYDGTIKVWNLANGTMVSEIQVGSPVHCLALSPEEQWVASGTRTGELFVHNLATGQKSGSLPLGATLNDVVFSPDEKVILAGDNTGKITVLTTSPLQSTKSFPAFSFRTNKITFTGESGIVFAVGRDSKRNLAYFNILTGDQVQKENPADDPTRSNFETGINTLLVSKGGVKMYLPDYASGIRVIDLIDKKADGHFYGKAKPIAGFSIDPSGKYLAIASNRDEILLLDLTGASNAKLLSGHEGWVKSIAFHPKEKLLVSSADDKTIKIWDTENWIVKASYTAGGSFSGTPIYFDSTSHGFYKKSNPEGIDVYDLGGKKKSNLDLEDVFEFRITPNGQTIVSKSPNTLSFYQAPKFKKPVKLNVPNITSYQLSADGSQVVTIDGQAIKIFDLASKKELKSFPMGKAAGGRQIRLVPEKKLALTWNTSTNKFGTSTDNTLKVWNIETGQLQATLDGHNAAITDVEVLHGRFVFTSSMDGTIRVWSLDETEAQKAYKASLIPLDDTNWVVTTSIGLFDATGPAMTGLHYVQQTEIIDINQLKDKYFEPSLLPKILGYNQDPIRTAEEINELSLYPEINLLHPSLNNGKLGIGLREQGGGYGRIVILINDKEIPQHVRDVVPIDKAQPEVTISYSIAGHPYLKEGDMNKISVKAYNENGDLVSSTKSVILLPDAKAKKTQPKLFALLSGVSDYQGNEIDLKYAAKDATDMADALKLSSNKYIGADNTTIRLLTTDSKDPAQRPTKENIKKVFEEFSKTATAADVLFIYMSGHGVSYGGPEGDFYYLTADAKNAKVDDENVRKSVTISSHEITAMISSIPAIKQLMIIDACHAGALASDMLKKQSTMNSSDIRALEHMKDKTGLYVLAGSAADAVSYEASSYGQGLLTYSLLFGIKGPALRDDEYVDVMRLFQFATEKVPQLVAGIGGVQKPEMRVPIEAASFDIGKVSHVEKSQIHLNNPKPVFIRTNLSDELQDGDDLDISAEVDSGLRGISAGGTGKIDFIDERKFSGGFSIRGRYTQKDGMITAKVKLFKDTTMTNEFTSSAATVAELAKAIIDEAMRLSSQ